jgi:hypothetical protein
MSQHSAKHEEETAIIEHQSLEGNNEVTLGALEVGLSAVPVLSSTPAKSASSSSSSLSGKPKFVRIKLLGKGGCAEVYLARDRESSNLLVRMILESDNVPMT